MATNAIRICVFLAACVNAELSSVFDHPSDPAQIVLVAEDLPKPVEVFQATVPVITPAGLAVDNRLIEPLKGSEYPYCYKDIMIDYVFGNSYGRPFVGMLQLIGSSFFFELIVTATSGLGTARMCLQPRVYEHDGPI
jgi:hypothetical protein